MTTNLAIEPSLLGATLDFREAGLDLRVCLPTKAALNRPKGHAETIVTTGWQKRGKREIPIEHTVYKVDVLAFPNREFAFPDHPRQNPQLIPAGTLAKLEGLASECEAAASAAFQRWLRIVRWVTMQGDIGEPQLQRNESGWSTTLEHAASGERLWSRPHTFFVRGRTSLNKAHWSRVRKMLVGGQDSPVHINLLFDAEWHLRVDDLNRSLVDAAMACELYMHSIISSRQPTRISPVVAGYVRRANAKTVYDQLFPAMLSETQQKAWHAKKGLKEQVERLFRARNDVVHQGRHDRLTRQMCEEHVKSAQTLLQLV